MLNTTTVYVKTKLTIVYDPEKVSLNHILGDMDYDFKYDNGTEGQITDMEITGWAVRD